MSDDSQAPELPPRTVRAAAARLAGHLVATPVIGGVLLPGFDVPAGLRVKPECLQPGGSLWFRGAKHHLLRQLGSDKGIVVAGTARQACAAAVAARSQRLPLAAVVVRGGDAAYGSETSVAGDEAALALLASLDCEIVVAADFAAARAQVAQLRQQRGFALLPWLENVDVAAGIATVGLELAEQLPAEVDAVFVAPAALAPVVAAGVRAGGRECEVRGVAVGAGVMGVTNGTGVPARLGAAVREGLRLSCDDAGLAGLAAALAAAGRDVTGAPCVVLGS